MNSGGIEGGGVRTYAPKPQARCSMIDMNSSTPPAHSFAPPLPLPPSEPNLLQLFALSDFCIASNVTMSALTKRGRNDSGDSAPGRSGDDARTKFGGDVALVVPRSPASARLLGGEDGVAHGGQEPPGGCVSTIHVPRRLRALLCARCDCGGGVGGGDCVRCGQEDEQVHRVREGASPTEGSKIGHECKGERDVGGEGELGDMVVGGQ